MILESVIEYLEDNDLGTFGTNIFSGELPYNKTDIISLTYIPSSEPNKAIDYYSQAVDIWARYTDSQAGYAKLKSILELFHKKANYEMGDYYVYLSSAMGMIDDMDRDQERRKLYKLTLNFTFRKNV